MGDLKRTLSSDFCRFCSKGQLDLAKNLINKYGRKIQYRDFHFGQGFVGALRNHHFEVAEWILTLFPTLDPIYIMSDETSKVTLEGIIMSDQFLPPMVIEIGHINYDDKVVLEWVKSHIDATSSDGKELIKFLKSNKPESDDESENSETKSEYVVKENIHDLLKQNDLIVLLPCFPDPHKFDLDVITKISYSYDSVWPDNIHKENYMKAAIIEMMCSEFISNHLMKYLEIPNEKCHECCKSKNKINTFKCGGWICEKCAKIHVEKFKCSYCKVEMCDCNLKESLDDTLLCVFCVNEGVHF